jgi:hypothetical protein
MRLGTLGAAFLCVALLAGAFAGGLAFMARSSTADREEASPPPPPTDKHEPKAAGEPKAEQGPQQVADQAPKQAPAAPKPLPKPEPKKNPLAFGVMAEADKVVGQRVTWVARPVSSNSDGGGAQHVFFGKGPTGEFSFGHVFLVKESVPYAQSPVRGVLNDLRARYTEGRHQEFREKQQLREEERNRQNEAQRQALAELRKGRPDAFRKNMEESRKRREELVKESAERRAKAKGPHAPPILVTVTGTIARFDALILLGHGQSNSVPVLRDVTIAPYPQPAQKR